MIRFLLLSLLIHGILIAVYRSEFPRVATPTSVPVKIRIVTKEKDPVGPPKAEPENAAGKATGIKPAQRPPRKPRESGAASPSAPAKTAPTYGDLLPSQAEGLALVERSQGARVGGLASFDPEADSYSVAEQTKSLGRLQQFALELGGRISTPNAVRELSPTGRAYLRLTKAADGWKVTVVRGDPYYRALLYEALSSIASSSYLATLLDDTEYPTVRIYLSMIAVSSLDQSTPPLVARTSANKVFLDYSHVRAEEKWQMAAPVDNAVGDDFVSPNFIGIASYLWSRAHERDPAEDGDAKKLRLSPAFLKPIGR